MGILISETTREEREKIVEFLRILRICSIYKFERMFYNDFRMML